ncbi:MAG: S1 family peptidase [Pseudobdellovibrio sp.]
MKKTNGITTLSTTKMGLSLCALIAASVFSSCSPSKQSNNSYVTENTQNQSAIVGGELSTSEFQKEHGIVQLIMISKSGSESLCTGSLIEKDMVITAAHCVADPFIANVVVVFKTDNKNLTDADIAFVKIAAVHEDFSNEEILNAGGTYNDIALLKLEKAAPANFKVARLPKKDEVIELAVNSKLTLSGYGNTNAIIRKEVINPITSRPMIISVPSVGSGTLRQVAGINVTAITADAKEISLDQSELKGACHGDSGGPALLTQTDGSIILVGVTSRGTEELGNCNVGSIYTGVMGHLDWITEMSSQLNKVENSNPQPTPENPNTRTESVAATL